VTSSAGVAQVSFSADSDEPTMPLEYRPLILMAAKAAWYRDMKDDARAAAVIQEFVARLDQMIGDQDIGAQKLRIRSNVQSYRNRARGPYRRAGSRYDINGRFDRFEED
jgi:hypothetical protein